MVNALDPQNMNRFSEASVSVEIETEDMTLNIGPQHPSTHGVLSCLLYTSDAADD